MLQRTPFEEPFLGAACYNLMLPIEPSDLVALSMARGDTPIFASAKIDASDDKMARTLGQLGFRRICTQILLHVHSDSLPGTAGDVRISGRLDLDPVDVRAHGLQLDSGRFRQDPLVPTEAAINLYTAWVRNSTGGAKRVASINRNFVSFEDSAPIRRIDLVSVLDKGVGIGVKLLTAIIEDARRRGLEEVKVVTDRDNLTALRTYRAVGFQPERSLAVLHLLR